MENRGTTTRPGGAARRPSGDPRRGGRARERASLRLPGVLLVGIAVLAACAPEPRVYTSPELAAYDQTAVAILPFDNLTATEGASRQVYDVFLVEFLGLKRFAVIDRGEVERVLSLRRIRFTSELSREEVRQIGAELRATLLVQGTVLEYGMRQVQGFQVAEVPYMTIVLKIIDSSTGGILWASTYSRNGNDTEKVFGLGRITSLNRLSEVMAREMVRSIADMTNGGRGI